jgi:simple sugar transport system substrate-binding protein
MKPPVEDPSTHHDRLQAVTRRQALYGAGGTLATAGLLSSLGPLLNTPTIEAASARAGNLNPNGPYYWIAHVGPGDPYWAVVQHGVKLVSQRLNVKATFEGPAGYNPSQQADMVNAAISAGAAGIVTTAANPASIADPVKRAAQAGIPVVFSDTPPPAGFAATFVGGTPLAFVGINIETAAKRAAAMVVPLLPHGARVVIVNHEPGNIVLETKSRGYIEGLASISPKVDRLVIGEQTTRAIEIMRAYYSRTPDLKAIFTLGALGTDATVKFLDGSKIPPSKIRVVGSDVDAVTLDAIKRGRVVATIGIDQLMYGFIPIVQLYLYNAYALIPNSYNSTGETVSKANVAAYAALAAKGYR